MTSVSFESTEEILGIVVHKPDESAKTNTSLANSELNTFLGYIKAIEEGTNVLNKYIEEHDTAVEFIKLLSTNNYINKVTVNDINNVFPEVLTTVANIKDFTDAPTKTGLEAILRFLNLKVNAIRDNILVTYTDSIYKYIEPVLVKFTDLELDQLRDMLYTLKTSMAFQLNRLLNNNKLQIFKDGELYKLIDGLLTDEFMDMLKAAPIEGLNIPDIETGVKAIKELIETKKQLLPQLSSDKDNSFRYIMLTGADFNLESWITSARSSLAALRNLSNSKKLILADNNTRDAVIDSLAKNPEYRIVHKHITTLVACLLFKELYNTIANFNVTNLKT
jgi:hypothetical protein